MPNNFRLVISDLDKLLAIRFLFCGNNYQKRNMPDTNQFDAWAHEQG